jgi:hypothetical protein
MRAALLLALVLCAAGASAGDLYRWVDAEGRVQFGDAPPPGVKAEKLGIKSRPTDPVAQAADEAKATQDDRVSAEAERVKDERAANAKQLAEAKAADCADAQKTYAEMRDERKILVTGTDGKETWVRGDDAIAAKEKARLAVAEHCGD